MRRTAVATMMTMGAAALLAGCGGGSHTDSSSAPASTSASASASSGASSSAASGPSSPASSSTSPDATRSSTGAIGTSPDSPLPDSFTPVGGVFVNGVPTAADGTWSGKVWTPSLGEMKECSFTLPAGAKEKVDSQPELIANTFGHVTPALLYQVLVSAEGLEGDHTETRATTLDFSTCALGRTTTLYRESVGEVQVVKPAYDDHASRSGEYVYLTSSSTGTSKPAVTAYDPAASKVVWTATGDAGTFWIGGPSPLYIRAGLKFLDAKTGKAASADDESKLVPYRPDQITLEPSALLSLDASGKQILVVKDDTGALVWVDEAGTPHTIVSKETMDKSRPLLVGASDGKVYLETFTGGHPNQLLTLDLTGKTVKTIDKVAGRQVDFPRAQWMADGKTWTLNARLTPKTNSQPTVTSWLTSK